MSLTSLRRLDLPPLDLSQLANFGFILFLGLFSFEIGFEKCERGIVWVVCELVGSDVNVVVWVSFEWCWCYGCGVNFGGDCNGDFSRFLLWLCVCVGGGGGLILMSCGGPILVVVVTTVGGD